MQRANVLNTQIAIFLYVVIVYVCGVYKMTNSKMINWLHNKVFNTLLLLLPRPSGSTHTIWQTSAEAAQYWINKQAAIDEGRALVVGCRCTESER